MRQDRKIYWGVGGVLLGAAGILGLTALADHLGYISIDVKGGTSGSGPTPNETATPDILSATPTLTATPTETPSPTATLPATHTPLSPTETQPTTIYLANPWTGELPFNNLVGLHGDEVMDSIMNGILFRSGGIDNPSRLDSTLTSLTNEFSPELFGTDPLTEPGFGHTAVDLSNYHDVRNVITNRDESTLSELLKLNSNGIITIELVGSEDDRDAALAILAAGQAFISRSLNGFTGNNTLQDVFNDSNAVAVVDEIQNDMFQMIQEKDLGVSDNEMQDRAADGGAGDIDASAGLPSALQESDQSLSCDVYRTSGDREEQLQATRQVAHKVDVKLDTFTEANSDNEQTLWVLSYDPATKQYKVGAFTGRGYSGPVNGQEFSASGEQKLPCGPGESNVPSQENTPQATYPTAVPTNPHRDEPNPEQTDEPDRVPPTQIP